MDITRILSALGNDMESIYPMIVVGAGALLVLLLILRVFSRLLGRRSRFLKVLFWLTGIVLAASFALSAISLNEMPAFLIEAGYLIGSILASIDFNGIFINPLGLLVILAGLITLSSSRRIVKRFANNRIIDDVELFVKFAGLASFSFGVLIFIKLI